MTIPIACPSCDARAFVDASLIGKFVRCKHCKYRFEIPDPDAPEASGYLLEEPTSAPSSRPDDHFSESISVFVPARGDEPAATFVPQTSRRMAAPVRSRKSSDPSRAWIIWLGVAVSVGLAVGAFVAPNIAALTMLALGSLLVLAGYAAGAYGAFREDFLYGFFYLAIPLYAAYYVITRWDDLWPWFVASTTGAGLITLGSWLIQSRLVAD